MSEYFIFVGWDGMVDYFSSYNGAQMRCLEETIIDASITEYVVGNKDDVIIICDESGANKRSCPPNFKASIFYNGSGEGHFIFGNVILAKNAGPLEGYKGFSYPEFKSLFNYLMAEDVEEANTRWLSVIYSYRNYLNK